MASTGAAIAVDDGSALRGIAFLTVGISMFSIMDVLIKTLSATYPAHEIVFFRGLVALLPILLIVQYEGGLRLLRTRRPVAHVVRGLFGFVTYMAFYLALTALPLAETVTLFYASPLFVTALAFPVLGELVGLRRWIAVLVGFAGVVVVTRPGMTAIEPAMLLAVGSAATYAIMIMMTRRLSVTEAGSTLAFYSMSTFIVASVVVGLAVGDGRFDTVDHPSAAFLLRAWSVPGFTDSLMLAACGLIAGAGFYCLSQAYRSASVSVVAPFEYTSLPWAILWGYVFFGDLPGATTLLGLALIVGSGFYIIHRETVKGRRLVRGKPMRPRI